MHAISAVNHEIGTIQDMGKYWQNYSRKHKVGFIVDAAQTLGKIQIDVQKWQTDLVSLSAHKTYGPKALAPRLLEPNQIELGSNHSNMEAGKSEA